MLQPRDMMKQPFSKSKAKYLIRFVCMFLIGIHWVSLLFCVISSLTETQQEWLHDMEQATRKKEKQNPDAKSAGAVSFSCFAQSLAEV